MVQPGLPVTIVHDQKWRLMEQAGIWEMSRKVVASEYESDTGCYQKGSLKGDSSSQLTVFCLLGGRCLAHSYQQGQKGQHCARTSPSHHQKAAPGPEAALESGILQS